MTGIKYNFFKLFKNKYMLKTTYHISVLPNIASVFTKQGLGIYLLKSTLLKSLEQPLFLVKCDMRNKLGRWRGGVDAGLVQTAIPAMLDYNLVNSDNS